MKRLSIQILGIALSGYTNLLMGQPRIDLSSVELSILNTSFEGRDVSFVLDQDDKEEKLIVSAGGADLKASFKFKQTKSRPPHHKDPGLKLTIRYTCYYLGDKRKDKHELTLWPEDFRSIKESINFNFEKGPNPLKVNLKFDGSLTL